MMKFSKTQSAFTLAEVLITLAVIGVVAVLTLPVLIQKNNEFQKVIKLKKIYSTLSQAQTNIIIEYGTFDNLVTNNTDTGELNEDGSKKLDYTNSEYLKSLFAKQLKVVESCDAGTNCLGKTVYYLRGVKWGDFYDPTLILADGTKLFFGWTTKCTRTTRVCLDIGVALPGANKDRYILGEDIFYFQVYSNKIKPEGSTNGALSSTDCRRSAGGRQCAAWVIYNENLDYLHCDDLSWGGKTKCK